MQLIIWLNHGLFQVRSDRFHQFYKTFDFFLGSHLLIYLQSSCTAEILHFIRFTVPFMSGQFEKLLCITLSSKALVYSSLQWSLRKMDVLLLNRYLIIHGKWYYVIPRELR